MRGEKERSWIALDHSRFLSMKVGALSDVFLA